jgi:DNA repair exonuclease SbcCD ATPase subunit
MKGVPMNDQAQAALDEGQTVDKLQTGDDLAAEALAAATPNPVLPAVATDDDEVAASDQLADTLNHLQNVIERNASELTRLKDELKQKRESLRSVFDNDPQLATVAEEAEKVTQQVKERKAKLQTDPQATSLKAQIGEISQEKKEIEEALNNHLLTYYQLTNSTSFDTSDGDQWEFKVKASLKGGKSSQ